MDYKTVAPPEYKIGGKIYVQDLNCINQLIEVLESYKIWSSVDNPISNPAVFFEKFSFFLATILKEKNESFAKKDLEQLAGKLRVSVDNDDLSLLIKAVGDFIDGIEKLSVSMGGINSKKKKFRIPTLFKFGEKNAR